MKINRRLIAANLLGDKLWNIHDLNYVAEPRHRQLQHIMGSTYPDHESVIQPMQFHFATDMLSTHNSYYLMYHALKNRAHL
jgi:hypothetical protein